MMDKPSDIVREAAKLALLATGGMAILLGFLAAALWLVMKVGGALGLLAVWFAMAFAIFWVCAMADLRRRPDRPLANKDPPMPTNETVPVVQGDRDAAADYMATVCRAMGEYNPVAMAFMDECCDETPIVQAFARYRLSVIEECCQRFERQISEGYPTPANKVDQCEHGKFGWEDCIGCYDEALLAAVEECRALATEGKAAG